MEQQDALSRRNRKDHMDGTTIVAVPAAAGFPRASGLRLGPDAILSHLDVNATDIARPGLDSGTVSEVTRGVRETTARLAAGGRVPLVVGGDHTVALGSVLGVRDGLRVRHGQAIPLFVLWLDAHPDVNTAETSPTGHLHGMVLSGLLGVGPLAVDEPLPPDQIALAGVRSFDPGELAFLQKQAGLTIWDVSVLRRPGHSWRNLAGHLLERVADRGGRLYVSLDLDVLDPHDAPGVAVPERNGAHARQLLALLEYLRGSGRLAGADVVELFPPNDQDERTVRIAAAAVRALSATRSRPTHASTPSTWPAAA
jgi:arginase